MLVNKLEIKNSNVGIGADSGTTLATITTQYLSVTNYSSLIAGSDVDIYTNGLMDDMPFASRQCCIYVNASSIILWGKVTVTRNTDIGIALSNGSNGFIGSLYGEGLTLGKFVVSGSKLCCDKTNVSSSQADWLGGGVRVNPYGAIIGTLSSDVTIYVSTTGSDSAGNGSSAKPYKTIQYAINTLPKDLGGYVATVQVADGTYDENINLQGFGNGFLQLYSSHVGILSSATKITSIFCSRGSAQIIIDGFEITTIDNGITCFNCTSIYIAATRLVSIAPSKIGIVMYEIPMFRVFGCEISNKADALYASNSCGYFRNTTGTNNTRRLTSSGASNVHIAGALVSGNNVQTAGGAIIFENGTQISDLVTSGLSCTWGTTYGSYHRHGNQIGIAQVIVQIRVTTTTPLTAGNVYYITGFPAPALQAFTTIAIATSLPQETRNIVLDQSGRIVFAPQNNEPAGFTIVFSCTYITNS